MRKEKIPNKGHQWLMRIITALAVFSGVPLRIQALNIPSQPQSSAEMVRRSSTAMLYKPVESDAVLEAPSSGGSATFGQLLTSQGQSVSESALASLPMKTVVATRVTYRGVPDQFQDSMTEMKMWGRLRRVSDAASFLCMIDCTLLPILMLGLPLIGLTATPNQVHALHDIGHKAALYFVVPTSALTSGVNFVYHRRVALTSLSALGIAMIVCANSHLAASWGLLHRLHCGVLHRIANVVGCSLVVGSNNVAKRLKGGCASLLCFIRCRAVPRKFR